VEKSSILAKMCHVIFEYLNCEKKHSSFPSFWFSWVTHESGEFFFIFDFECMG